MCSKACIGSRDGIGVTSEVGRLRTVLLHRPGDELKRLTPRNNVELLFDGIPWLERAQEEHDAFAAALRDRGVEVLYFFDLLTAALEVPQARAEVVTATVAPAQVGPALAPVLREHLLGLSSEQLAEVLTAGLSYEEITGASESALRSGVVARLAPPHSFVIPPLPNLLFTRDSSVWLDEQRRRHEPVHAGARPRGVARPGDLPVRPALRRNPFALRRCRARASRGVPGGRRRTPARARGRGHRGRRAHDSGRRGDARRPRAGGRRRAGGARRPRRAAPRHHAPGHGVHDGRHRRRRHVPADCPYVAGISGHRRGCVGTAAVPDRSRRSDGHRAAARHRDRPRPGDRRARAMGRRQQHPRHRPASGRGLRTQRRDQRPPRGRRHRGRPHPRLGARLRPRRPALHELPRRPRAP